MLISLKTDLVSRSGSEEKMKDLFTRENPGEVINSRGPAAMFVWRDWRGNKSGFVTSSRGELRIE